MNPLLLGPALIRHALDDLSAIADAARRLTSLEAAVLDGLGRIEGELGGLREELAPIAELPAVRAAVEPLRRQLDSVDEGLGAIQEELRPIADITAVRKGVEPLDEDMRVIRLSVDELEPLLREVNQRLERLDGRIETMRSDLAPLGELADKVPGVGRR